MILNLKRLNSFVQYHHFKMDTFQTVLKVIRPNCFMASLDLRHAYYTVPIAPCCQHLLRFQWRDKLYQYTCLPNGLASAPRVFTKLLKPIYATLRQMGHVSVAYIDDSYLQGSSYQECQRNVSDTMELFTKLGFTIHPEKSVLQPTRRLVFLGFVIDSTSMSISLTAEKTSKLRDTFRALLRKVSPTIRDVAQVTGSMVSVFPAVPYGQLRYRQLEMDKIHALKRCHNDFESPMELSPHAKQDLQWWINTIEHTRNPIMRQKPECALNTDASLLGWGATCSKGSTGGRWTSSEKGLHINALELKAAFYGIQAFFSSSSDTHVLLRIDNSTAVAHINHMGGTHSDVCNSCSREMLEWCGKRAIWVTAVFIPGKSNFTADWKSRHFSESMEWKLNGDMFQALLKDLRVQPTIDLFASRLNTQLKRYVSWRPDPFAVTTDAFTMDWGTVIGYAFPLFHS